VEYIMDGVDFVPYPTSNYLLEVAGINNEVVQESGLQLGAKADDSRIGSAKHVLGGGGSGRHHGGVWEYNFNLQLHVIV
jgi:hypothetical protein